MHSCRESSYLLYMSFSWLFSVGRPTKAGRPIALATNPHVFVHSGRLDLTPDTGCKYMYLQTHDEGGVSDAVRARCLAVRILRWLRGHFQFWRLRAVGTCAFAQNCT